MSKNYQQLGKPPRMRQTKRAEHTSAIRDRKATSSCSGCSPSCPAEGARFAGVGATVKFKPAPTGRRRRIAAPKRSGSRWEGIPLPHPRASRVGTRFLVAPRRVLRQQHQGRRLLTLSSAIAAAAGKPGAHARSARGVALENGKFTFSRP